MIGGCVKGKKEEFGFVSHSEGKRIRALVKMLEAAAYRRGQEAMRERAAKEALNVISGSYARTIARAIRALEPEAE